MPRELLHPKPEHYAKAEILWGPPHGISDRQIGIELGFKTKRWKEILRRDTRMKEARSRGRSREETSLVNRLYQIATEGPPVRAVPAAIFLLKSRHGYIDKPEVLQQQVPNNRVEVTFQIPAPLSRDRYQELIEVTPKKRLKEAQIDAA